MDDASTEKIGWLAVFDLLASEYKTDWNQFLDLTFKQVYYFFKTIAARRFKEMQFKAALAGIELKEPDVSPENTFSEETSLHIKQYLTDKRKCQQNY